jgi:hypothetical protein
MTSKFSILTKRQRFIVSSILSFALSIGFHNIGLPMYGGILMLLIGGYLLTYYSLKEDISGVEYITLFILPILFLVGVNLFMTLLPNRKIFQYPIFLLIPIGMYITYLTENIFNVAAIRTIQLLRAAHAVAYIFTLFTAYFLISFIVSLHLGIIYQVVIMALIVLPLTLQFLWTFDLMPLFSKRTVLYSGAICLVFVQILIMSNFYPQSTAMTSLFLVAVFYVLLGILQHFYEKKLTRKPTIEYTIVACIVFIIMLYTAQWIG